MKVIHILWSGRPGGKERAVYHLARSQLGSSRFQPAVAFGQADGFYVDKLRELDCPVVDLAMRRGGDLFRIPSLVAKLKPYDIHHFHSAETTIMLGSVLCRKVKRLYTHRGGIPSSAASKQIGYRMVGLLLRHFFHGLAGNTRHATIAGSLLTRISQSRWSVTYNGMDFSQLEPKTNQSVVAARHGLKPGSMTIIGTSANLRALKRNELLLQACSALPKDRFQLLIVGDGPDRPRLETFARQLNLERNTVFAGMQEHIGDYLALMDVFVLASGRQESFGNSAVEAMSVGLPTLVFQDGGGLPEHIQNDRTGFVVGSVDELAAMLGRLLADPEQRKEVGRNAARYVRETYSLESMVRRYNAFYEQALNLNGGPLQARTISKTPTAQTKVETQP